MSFSSRSSSTASSEESSSSSEEAILADPVEEEDAAHLSTTSITGKVIPPKRILIKKFTNKDKITIEGKADPDSDLIVTIFSQPIKKNVRSDSTGKWSVSAGPLAAGQHRVEVTYADNPDLTPKLIANFEVVKDMANFLWGSLLLLTLLPVAFFTFIWMRKRRLAYEPSIPASPDLSEQFSVPNQPEVLPPSPLVPPVPAAPVTPQSAPIPPQTSVAAEANPSPLPVNDNISLSSNQAPVLPPEANPLLQNNLNHSNNSQNNSMQNGQQQQ